VHRISLTAATRRRFPLIFGLLVVLAGVIIASPGVALAADPKIEKEAQALEKKAIEEDNLNVNYAGAIKKLQSAITKCGGDKCNSSLKAALLRDLGAMQVLNGNVEEGKASFGQAIGMDATIALDPAYKNPQLEGIWNEVKKKGGGGAPAKAGPEPSGDFVHSPPKEALVRTPLPVSVEYSGSESLTRVTVKYKGFGQADWKTIELKKTDSGFGALIPCKDVTQGLMEYFVQGFTDQRDPVATSGTRTKPFTVPVNLQISGPAPSLPGEEPPAQCADSGECPPDFPGCGGGKKKAGGEQCAADAECDSSSCVDDKCVDKKGSGDDCAADTECSSGTCTSGKCTGKKAEGDDCEADEDCDSDRCSAGKCTSSSRSSKAPKIWVGLGAQLDVDFLPGANNVCLVPSQGVTAADPNSGYACVDPSSGTTFPSLRSDDLDIKPGAADQVVGGLRLGNIRIFLSGDYALNHNMLVGLRAGYVFRTVPVGSAFAPLHFEARFTYVIGKDALSKKGLSPMVFAGVGVGEFDAFVPVTVVNNSNQGFAENAWTTAGPVFFAVGGGGRYLISPKVAATAALKFQGAFGGTAGFLPGVAPELGVQLGF
jgi:hypothetical protein